MIEKRKTNSWYLSRVLSPPIYIIYVYVESVNIIGNHKCARNQLNSWVANHYAHTIPLNVAYELYNHLHTLIDCPLIFLCCLVHFGFLSFLYVVVVRENKTITNVSVSVYDIMEKKRCSHSYRWMHECPQFIRRNRNENNNRYNKSKIYFLTGGWPQASIPQTDTIAIRLMIDSNFPQENLPIFVC